jgi:D-sedoheptulose 7-phosphate isomerase
MMNRPDTGKTAFLCSSSQSGSSASSQARGRPFPACVPPFPFLRLFALQYSSHPGQVFQEKERKVMTDLLPVEEEILSAMLARRPDLDVCVPALRELHAALAACYDNGGCFFTCGNGGSNADAMHIVGELCKSFERRRPLDPAFSARLADLPHGGELAEHLEAGLPAVALGFNGALKTAVENDSPQRDIAFAQELNALMRPGDTVLGISTSGNASNCLMALSVAKAKGGTAVALTGPDGGRMAACADIAIRAPGGSTKEVQEAHLVLYHTFCCLIEAHYYPDMRG